MKQFVSPKQVAQAIDVSESSLKRWCDQGLIPTIKTAGGHRRLPISGVADFLRQSGRKLVRPEVLGLPTHQYRSSRIAERTTEILVEALLAGEESRCRRIVLDLYLAGHSVASIGDQLISPAFQVIGDRWECGEADIYQERQGCELMRRTVTELGQLIEIPKVAKGVAICAAVSGDQYQLPTLLVELVLRSTGFRTIVLGGNLPFDSLCAAAIKHQPTLFCLSVSHISNRDELEKGLVSLTEQLPPETQLILGGRAVSGLNLDDLPQCMVLKNLTALESSRAPCL